MPLFRCDMQRDVTRRIFMPLAFAHYAFRFAIISIATTLSAATRRHFAIIARRQLRRRRFHYAGCSLPLSPFILRHAIDYCRHFRRHIISFSITLAFATLISFFTLPLSLRD